MLTNSKSLVDPKRVVILNRGEAEAKSIKNGQYVLYWLQMTRRVNHNFALQYAVEKANELCLPLIVYESVRCDYPWACDRFHQLLLEGVLKTKEDLKKMGIAHFFLLETKPGQYKSQLLNVARKSAFIVADDYPCFIIPEHNRILSDELTQPAVAVDSNGIIPMRHFEKQEYAARTIRPKIYKILSEHLKGWRVTRPKVSSLNLEIKGCFTEFGDHSISEWVKKCPIDHTIKPHPRYQGGRQSALKTLSQFLKNGRGYSENRNNAGIQGTSELSMPLHFGYLSALEIALGVRDSKILDKPDKDAFLEELIVRRELSFNYALFCPHFNKLEGLPQWVQKNFELHRHDKRTTRYSIDELELSQTHDEIWNAAQRELVKSGKIHGYLRMLWGKKILEWTRSPEIALEVMIHLNNKYAVDGRDPNSYTGIQWCLGLHDRPWFPKRPVFGCVRYMSSDSTKKKLDWRAYLSFVSNL